MADITPSTYVESALAGERAYAIHIDGDVLAPDVTDGQCAVFDPDAGLGLQGEIVAVWVHESSQPFVVRLAHAVPPFSANEADELCPVLTVRTDRGFKAIDMARVAKVHRMVDAVDVRS